jgi:formylglycine-generating enzyme required for sulfatase activity/poly(3-hydroxybutyrate) depolymerase/TPR repeat protein
MADTGGTRAGMLGTDAAYRPSFLRYLVWLYRSDTTFSSVTDFTVIGTVVILFLILFPAQKTAPPNTPQSSGPPAATSQTTPTPKAASPSTPVSPSVAPSAPAVPTDLTITFSDEVTKPSFANFIVVDIDETAFRRSTAADQQKLAAANRAYRSEQFAEAIGILNDATPADPNVAFVRALAIFNADPGSAKSATDLLRSAADQGQHQASIMLGRMLVRPPDGVTGDLARGRQLLETAAAGGDRLAQRLAGIGYLSGDFGGINPGKARELLRAAAQSGDPPAMLLYSFLLGTAIGGPVDQAAAVDLIRRAAAAGLTQAQETIGAWLLERYRRKQIDDPREGIEWLERATKVGLSFRALQLLAAFHGDDKNPAPWRDKGKLFELARLCSGARSPWCQAENGWVFDNAIGTDRNLVRAFAHFQVAAELGLASARKSLQLVDGRLKDPNDRLAAVGLAQTIRAALKPTPTPWHLQYVGAAPPRSWPAAPDVVAAAPVPVTRPPAAKQPAPAVGLTRPIPGQRPLSAAQESALKPLDSFKECEACPEMVVVPAGSFIMGSSEIERGPIISAIRNLGRPLDRDYAAMFTIEGPQRTVTLARPFVVGRFSVTFEEWDACVSDGGCNKYRPADQGWGRGRQPVINISWNDAKIYVAWLSRKTGKTYRLLSEAEREYAARAGTTTRFWWGDTVSISQANFNGGSLFPSVSGGGSPQKALPVDSFSPNPWGLYQMHGNSYDWVEDCYHDSYNGAPSDGSAWTAESCDQRVVRGGAWSSHPFILRSTYRNSVAPDHRTTNVGVRVARSLGDVPGAAADPAKAQQVAAPTQPAVSGGRMQLVVNGQARTVLLERPAEQTPRPTIIMLHGAGGSSERELQSSGLGQIATRNGFVAVFPDGRGGRWNHLPPAKETEQRVQQFFQPYGGVPDDISFLKMLAADLIRRGISDQKRIYLAGWSNGGLMTLRMACTGDETFAAIGLLVASMPEPTGADCRPPKPLPVLMMNGTADNVVPYGGGVLTSSDGKIKSPYNLWPVERLIAFLRQYNGCPGLPEKTVLPGQNQQTVEIERSTNCSNGPVVFYRVVGGGHNPRPAAPNTSQLLVDFFSDKVR